MTDALFGDPLPVPLEEQIKCVEREIGFRERCYPRWVIEHKMTQRKMDDELRAMRAVLRTLKGLLEASANAT
jgi:hypothetical protein